MVLIRCFKICGSKVSTSCFFLFCLCYLLYLFTCGFVIVILLRWAFIGDFVFGLVCLAF